MTTGMYDVVKDWSVYATQIDIMHRRLSKNGEKEAMEMRQKLAQSIVDAYANDGNDATNITLEEAMGYIDSAYQSRTGQSLVETIDQTTRKADSFWNYVPIVNLFIDDTTAEDVYQMMDGKEPNIKKAEGKFAKTASTTAQGAAAGAAIGAACGGGIGAIPGAIIGGIVGLASGLLD